MATRLIEVAVTRCLDALLAVRYERPGTEVYLEESDVIMIVRKCREVRPILAKPYRVPCPQLTTIFALDLPKATGIA